MGRGRCSQSVLAWVLSLPGHHHHSSLAPSLLQPLWEAAGHGWDHAAGMAVPMCQHGPYQNWIPTMRSIATATLKTFSSTHGQINSPTLFFTKWEPGTGRGAVTCSCSHRKALALPEHNLPFLPPSPQLQELLLPPQEAARLPRGSAPSNSPAGQLVPEQHREGKRGRGQRLVCFSLLGGRRGPSTVTREHHFLSGNPSKMWRGGKESFHPPHTPPGDVLV